MREIRPSGSMSGECKRSMADYSGTGNRKGQQHARSTFTTAALLDSTTFSQIKAVGILAW
jgi:hypothetical protein